MASTQTSISKKNDEILTLLRGQKHKEKHLSPKRQLSVIALNSPESTKTLSAASGPKSPKASLFVAVRPSVVARSPARHLLSDSHSPTLLRPSGGRPRPEGLRTGTCRRPVAISPPTICSSSNPLSHVFFVVRLPVDIYILESGDRARPHVQPSNG